MAPLVTFLGVVGIVAGIAAFYFIVKRVWNSTFQTEFDYSETVFHAPGGGAVSTFTLGSLKPPKVRVTRRPPPKRTLLEALLVVVVIFLLTVGVLWALTRIGGPQGAEVNATIHRLGGTIWISAAGLVGCFIVISAVAFIAIYYLSRK
jgi:hypothetical protein